MKLKDRPTPGLIDSAQFKSRHNVNDPVVIYFGNSGIIQNCKVIKIHFTESTVSYDVEVKWTHEDQEYENTDRLYNLHSSIVFNQNDFEETKKPDDAALVDMAKKYTEKEYGKTENKVLEKFTEAQFHECVTDAFVDGYNASQVGGLRQKHSNFTVRLKAHVEKCLKKSGMTTLFLDSPPYHERETIRRAFMDSLGEGAIDALQVSGCVEKYIPKQNKES